MIEERVRKRGMKLIVGAALAGAEKKGGMRIQFSDGELLNTEMLVLSERGRPPLVNPEEIKVDRGIVVNERNKNLCRGPAGDCCQGTIFSPGQTQIIGLWADAGVQGRVAGHNMAGVDDGTDGKYPS